MNSVKEQTIKSVKWNGIERFVGQGMQFLLTLFMARLLTPSDYGLIGLLTIFITISQTFIDSGFNTALLRTKCPKPEDYSTVFFFNFIIAIVVYVILYCIAPQIARFFNQPLLVDILRIYSLSLLINSLMAVQVAKLQVELDFKSLAIIRLLAVVLSGAIGIYLAYCDWGVWALVSQNISYSVISLVIICSVCRWLPKEGFNLESFKRLGSFGSRLLAASILDAIYKNLTRLAIGKFYSSSDLGNYERGAQFAELPNKSINDVLSTVTFPILAKIQDDEDHLIAVYRRYIQMSSMVIFIVSGLLCALAKPIILFTLTEKWVDAIIFLHVFSFSCMFDHLNTINLNLLKVKGRSDLFLRLEVFKKTISLIILMSAIPFGVFAICLSKVLYNQIAIFCNTYYTGKLFKYGYIEQFRDFLPYLCKTIIACVPAYAITLAGMSNIATIIVGAFLSIIIYLLLLRNDNNLKELIKLLRSFRKKY